MRRKQLLSQLKKTLRKLDALNILLITAFTSLAYSSYGILSSPYDPGPQNTTGIENSESGRAINFRQRSSDFTSFNAVPAKNLFRPERTEYVKPREIAPPPPLPPPPKPVRKLPAPDLTLNGVLLSDKSNKTAMISGHYFTPRSRVNLKQQRYKEGDLLGTYKIIEISRRAVMLTDTKSDKKLALSLKFSGFKTARTQRRSHPASAVRSRVSRPARRGRVTGNVPAPGVPHPPFIPPGRPGSSKTGGRQTIPAVYSGGRVYYPQNGSPPPQRISGDLSPAGEQYPSGNR